MKQSNNRTKTTQRRVFGSVKLENSRKISCFSLYYGHESVLFEMNMNEVCVLNTLVYFFFIYILIFLILAKIKFSMQISTYLCVIRIIDKDLLKITTFFL